MYKVSVVIPVYNVSKYVEESLKSALNQSFESVEYVLVDDCCTDDSFSIIHSVLDASPRKKDVFIYKHSKNRGLSASRNTGLEKASGEYVFFMDSDDEISRDCIKMHYQAMTISNAEFSIANMKLVGGKSFHVSKVNFNEKVGMDILKSFLERKWNISACNKLYEVSFLKDNNLIFQEGILHEDILWSYYVSLTANKFVTLNEETYLYKIRGNSITTSQSVYRRIDDLLFILKDINSNINSRCCFQTEFGLFVRYWQFNAALLLLNVQSSYKKKREYYKIINAPLIKSGIKLNYSSFLLLLPFPLFFFLLKVPYSLYKKYNRFLLLISKTT